MSEKIYAWLLRLYPPSFQKAYGEEAMQLFRDRARDEQGFLSGLRLWLDLLADLAASIPREYRHIPSTLLAAAAQPCWDGTPSFHVLEDEAPRPGALFYGGILSLVVYGSVLFVVSHGRSYFPLSDSSVQQRPSYALSPKVAMGAQAAASQGIAVHAPEDIAGNWQGTLEWPATGNSPSGKLRVVLKIAKAEDGGWSALYYFIDQSGQPRNTSDVMLKGTSFSYLMPSLDARYEGKLSADGQAIVGTWTHDTPLPMIFARASKETAWEIPPPPPVAPAPEVVTNSKEFGGMLHASDPRPSFEVASIRPSAPNAEFGGMWPNADGITIRGASTKDLIEFAYAVPNENEFSGGPSWIRTERFDISAKPDEAEAAAFVKLSRTDLDVQMRLMLQSLLEERFKLKVSFAMKELPLFALVVAKDGFKCAKGAADGPFASMWHPRYGSVGPPPPPPPPGYVPPMPGHESWRDQPMHWAPHGWPFWMLVASISIQPELGGRIVVDKTGLGGVYDCDVSWTHEGAEVPGPSFFTAIQEQMGLKLEPEKGPVEVIVIDSIERPSEN